jgi:hypothetical protein
MEFKDRGFGLFKDDSEEVQIHGLEFVHYDPLEDSCVSNSLVLGEELGRAGFVGTGKIIGGDNKGVGRCPMTSGKAGFSNTRTTEKDKNLDFVGDWEHG